MKKIAIFLLALFFTSCGSGNSDLKITSVRKDFKKTFGNCQTGACMEFTVVYDSLVSANANVQPINKFIKDKFFENFSEASKPSNINEFYELTKKDFAEFIAENPDYRNSWRYDNKMTMECFCNLVVSLKYDNYEFTGGAHGNETVAYYNFKFKNGKPVLLKNVFSKEEQEAIIKEIKKGLHKKFKIKDSMTLKEGGLWGEFVKSNKFNNNFKISEKGLTFIFNQYEIAPYSEGMIEIFVPFKNLPKSVYEKLFK